MKNDHDSFPEPLLMFSNSSTGPKPKDIQYTIIEVKEKLTNIHTGEAGTSEFGGYFVSIN